MYHELMSSKSAMKGMFVVVLITAVGLLAILSLTQKGSQKRPTPSQAEEEIGPGISPRQTQAAPIVQKETTSASIKSVSSSQIEVEQENGETSTYTLAPQVQIQQMPHPESTSVERDVQKLTIEEVAPGSEVALFFNSQGQVERIVVFVK